MKIKATFLSIFIVVSFLSLAQEEEKERGEDNERSSFKFDPKKIFLGGSLGANFTSNGSFVDVSPMVGYRFTEKFMAGPGVIYRYNSIQGVGTHHYGAKAFARYFIKSNLFAHAEYEYLDWQPIFFDGNSAFKGSRRQAGSLLIGGGYSQPLGQRAQLNITILADVLNDPNSPYQQMGTRINGIPFPIIFRAGIGF